MSIFSPILRPVQPLDLTDLLESLNSSQEITACRQKLLLKSGVFNTGRSTNSNKSNRSKYSNNSKLLKSNLFQVMKNGQAGKIKVKEDEKMSVELLKQTLGLLRREDREWQDRWRESMCVKGEQSYMVIRRLQSSLNE